MRSKLAQGRPREPAGTSCAARQGDRVKGVRARRGEREMEYLEVKQRHRHRCIAYHSRKVVRSAA